MLGGRRRRRVKPFDGLGQRPTVAPEHGDVGAVRREFQGDRGADPLAAAGHQRVAVGERQRRSMAGRGLAPAPLGHGNLPPENLIGNLIYAYGNSPPGRKPN